MAIKYCIGGLLFGCLFPIFSWFFDCHFVSHISFSLQSLEIIHKNTSLHYVIDTAPFFLGIAFGFAGFKQDIILKERTKLEQLIIIRTKDLENKNIELTESLKVLNKHKIKLNQAAFLNSHDVRRHLATLIGLIKLLEIENNESDDFEYIRKSILLTSEELDKSIMEIAKQLHNE